MDSGIIILLFTETIDALSFNSNFVTLKSGNNTSSPNYTLQFSSNSQLDSDSVVLYINDYDLNIIKSIDLLAIGSESSRIQLGAETVHDTVGNYNDVQLTALSAFTSDSTPPSILNFTLDMDNGLLNITFSETIESSTVDLPSLSLLNEHSLNSLFPLTSGEFYFYQYLYMTIFLSYSDLNFIKINTQLAYSQN